MNFEVLSNSKHSVILSAYDACPATAGSEIPSAPANLMENWDLHSQTNHRPKREVWRVWVPAGQHEGSNFALECRAPRLSPALLRAAAQEFSLGFSPHFHPFSP